MSDIRVEVKADRVLAGLDKLAPSARSNMVIFITEFTARLANQVRSNIASIFRSAGPLYDSVDHSVTETTRSVRGDVFTRGVPYARIQEEGGTTRAHTIVPRVASVLAFEGPAGLVFAKRVNHPGSNIPARPYASLALSQMRGEFSDGMRQVVATAIGDMNK
jgi:hypothetical protein